MSNKKKLFKKGQLVVIAITTGTCSCGMIPKGTIVEIEEDRGYNLHVKPYKNMDWSETVTRDRVRTLTIGKERLLAKKAFAKTNQYSYAHVESLSFIKK